MKINLSERTKNVSEYFFSKKLEEIEQLKKNGFDVINLGIGGPDLLPPKNVLTNFTNTINNNKSCHSYSSHRGLYELRKEYSNWNQKKFKIELNPNENILPLLGSKEGIFYLSMALLNKGDSVLVPNPGYPTYSSVAKILDANIITYDLNENSNWLPNFKMIEESIKNKNCKLMWINYPHMPTGASCNRSFFDQLVQFAKKNNIYIVNDNPYSFILNQTEPISIINSDPSLECVGELNSLSKTYNMAGWRVGFFSGHKKIVNAILTLKSNVDSGMFLPIQMAAIEALKENNEWHTQLNSEYLERKQILYEIFDLLNLDYSKNQTGLFLWGKSKNANLNIENFLNELLIKSHIFLTPGFIFGTNGTQYIRASLCLNKVKMIEALERIRKHNL